MPHCLVCVLFLGHWVTSWLTRGQVPPQESPQVSAFQNIIAQTKVTAAKAAVQRPHSAYITRLDFSFLSSHMAKHYVWRLCSVYTDNSRPESSSQVCCHYLHTQVHMYCGVRSEISTDNFNREYLWTWAHVFTEKVPIHLRKKDCERVQGFFFRKVENIINI